MSKQQTTGETPNGRTRAEPRHPAVRPAGGPRYGSAERLQRERTGVRIAVPSAADSAPPRRDKIHSILTALPVIMLVAGLYYWYSNESAQSAGEPIVAESVVVQGVFDGVSVIRSGGEGRHYLWFDDGRRRRGARVHAVDLEALGVLEKGDAITLRLAPTVSGSSTLWAWRVERDGSVLLDASRGGGGTLIEP